TGAFDCSSIATLGPYVQQLANQGTCAAQCPGVPTVPGIGANCLQDTFNASIAIDRTVNPQTLVASFASATSPLPSSTVTRWFTSASNSNTWTPRAQTNAISVKPRTTGTWTPTLGGFANVFGTQTTTIVGAGPQVAQADWTSTDGGHSWSGVFA